MATGDLNGNLQKLLRELRAIKYPAEVDEIGLKLGDPVASLPLLSFVLLKFSRHVASSVVRSGFQLAGKTDHGFIENAFKLLRDEMGIKTVLSTAQFFGQGFAERKVILVSDTIAACKKIHNDEVRKERLAALASNKRQGDAANRLSAPRKSPDVKVVRQDGQEVRQVMGSRHLPNASDGGQSVYAVKRVVARSPSRSPSPAVSAQKLHVAASRNSSARSSPAAPPIGRAHGQLSPLQPLGPLEATLRPNSAVALNSAAALRPAGGAEQRRPGSAAAAAGTGPSSHTGGSGSSNKPILDWFMNPAFKSPGQAQRGQQAHTGLSAPSSASASPEWWRPAAQQQVQQRQQSTLAAPSMLPGHQVSEGHPSEWGQRSFSFAAASSQQGQLLGQQHQHAAAASHPAAAVQGQQGQHAYNAGLALGGLQQGRVQQPWGASHSQGPNQPFPQSAAHHAGLVGPGYASMMIQPEIIDVHALDEDSSDGAGSVADEQVTDKSDSDGEGATARARPSTTAGHFLHGSKGQARSAPGMPSAMTHGAAASSPADAPQSGRLGTAALPLSPVTLQAPWAADHAPAPTPDLRQAQALRQAQLQVVAHHRQRGASSPTRNAVATAAVDLGHAEQGSQSLRRTAGGRAHTAGAGIATSSGIESYSPGQGQSGAAGTQVHMQQLESSLSSEVQALQARLVQAEAELQQTRAEARQGREALQARMTVLEGRTRFLECELELCVKQGGTVNAPSNHYAGHSVSKRTSPAQGPLQQHKDAGTNSAEKHAGQAAAEGNTLTDRWSRAPGSPAASMESLAHRHGTWSGGNASLLMPGQRVQPDQSAGQHPQVPSQGTSQYAFAGYRPDTGTGTNASAKLPVAENAYAPDHAIAPAPGAGAHDAGSSDAWWPSDPRRQPSAQTHTLNGTQAGHLTGAQSGYMPGAWAPNSRAPWSLTSAAHAGSNGAPTAGMQRAEPARGYGAASSILASGSHSGSGMPQASSQGSMAMGQPGPMGHPSAMGQHNSRDGSMHSVPGASRGSTHASPAMPMPQPAFTFQPGALMQQVAVASSAANTHMPIASGGIARSSMDATQHSSVADHGIADHAQQAQRPGNAYPVRPGTLGEGFAGEGSKSAGIPYPQSSSNLDHSNGGLHSRSVFSGPNGYRPASTGQSGNTSYGIIPGRSSSCLSATSAGTGAPSSTSAVSRSAVQPVQQGLSTHVTPGPVAGAMASAAAGVGAPAAGVAAYSRGSGGGVTGGGGTGGATAGGSGDSSAPMQHGGSTGDVINSLYMRYTEAQNLLSSLRSGQ